MSKLIIRERILHQEIENHYEVETYLNFGELSFGSLKIIDTHNGDKLLELFSDIIQGKLMDVVDKLGLNSMTVTSLNNIWIDCNVQSYMFQSNIKYNIIFEIEVDLTGETISISNDDSKNWHLQLY